MADLAPTSGRRPEAGPEGAGGSPSGAVDSPWANPLEGRRARPEPRADRGPYPRVKSRLAGDPLPPCAWDVALLRPLSGHGRDGSPRPFPDRANLIHALDLEGRPRRVRKAQLGARGRRPAKRGRGFLPFPAASRTQVAARRISPTVRRLEKGPPTFFGKGTPGVPERTTGRPSTLGRPPRRAAQGTSSPRASSRRIPRRSGPCERGVTGPPDPPGDHRR